MNLKASDTERARIDKPLDMDAHMNLKDSAPSLFSMTVREREVNSELSSELCVIL